MSYPDITEAILLEGAPVESFDRTTAALNVVGASTSASRSLLDTNTSNYIYVNTSTGNDTTGTGAVGAPYKTLTKAYSVWSSGKVVHVVNSDAITLGSGAETTTSIDRATQAAVGIAPVVSLSGAWTSSAGTDASALDLTAIKTVSNGTMYAAIADQDAYDSGRIQTSTDGLTWTLRTLTGCTVKDIAWGNGIWVACGNGTGDARIKSSTDGVTWTSRASDASFTLNPRSVVYGHAGFCMVSCSSSGAMQIQKSTNGTSWSSCTAPSQTFDISTYTYHFTTALYANGRYYFYGSSSSGKIVYSDDLVTFSVYTGNPQQVLISPNGYAYGNGVFISANGYRSYDGFNFTPLSSLSGVTLSPGGTGSSYGYHIAYGAGVFVIAGGLTSGYLYYSYDNGDIWSSSDYSAIGYADGVGFGHLGFVIGGSGAYIRLAKGGIRLKGSICGFDFASSGLYIASTNAAVTILNCDADYGIDAVKDSNGFTVKNSVVRNIRSIENIPAELSENVVTGNVELFKTYASTNDVNRNTFVGAYSDWDTTTTDIDQFRDNIIEGGISTNRVLTVESGNVRGGTSASVTLTSGAVSAVAPLFIGTGSTPYALRRVADGFPTDSPLLEASTLYDPDGTSGSGRDYGAYSFDATAVSESWTVAFWLPRPTQATFATVPKAYYSPTRSGAINGINRPEGWAEQIAVQWTNLTQEQYANLLLLADETSTRVRLTWNPSLSSLTSVTANGAASLGDIVLTVDASAIPVGAIVTIGGEEHRVIKRYPETGNATQLIFNQKLAAAVSDNEVLTVTGSTGYGEYLIKWPDTLGAVPWVSTDQDNYSGLGLAFVRARP